MLRFAEENFQYFVFNPIFSPNLTEKSDPEPYQTGPASLNYRVEMTIKSNINHILNRHIEYCISFRPSLLQIQYLL